MLYTPRAARGIRFVKVSGRPAHVAAAARSFRPLAFAAEQLLGRPLDARAAAALFERVAAEPVPERQRRHTLHVGGRDRRASLERGEGSCGARDRYLAAVPVHAEPQAKLGYLSQDVRRDFDAREL